MTSLLGWAFGPRLSIVHEFRRPPYGGGNQFLLALRGELQRRGYDVGAGRVGPRTRHVLFNSFNFDMDRLRAQLGDRRRRGIRTLHRVDGPIGAYRGRDEPVDREIHRINRELSDFTVFQSRYSLDKHLAMGLDFGDAVAVIPNAVNPRIFHRGDRARQLDPSRERVRVIATSWSPNRRKGAEIYEWLDRHLDFSRFEFTFIGNVEAAFSNIRVEPPLPSAALARRLREHDIYITGSRNDPCSNALTEALACGLPAVYLVSGGHPEIVKQAGYGFHAPEEVPALLERTVATYEQCVANIAVPGIAEVADRYAEHLGLYAAEGDGA